MTALRILLFLIIHFAAGVIVMIVHEYPKKMAAFWLIHPIYRTKKLFQVPLRKYIDPIGLILFTFGFSGLSQGALSFYSFYAVGWQKPYEYNPTRFRDKEKSLLYITLAGQLSSLMTVFLTIPIFNILNRTINNIFVLEFVWSLMVFSFVIFIVNLLPIPPFDMSKMIYAFSPNTYFRISQNQRLFHLVFIILVAIEVLQIFSATILLPLYQIYI